jgi:endo-1,4-beta-xylanase
MFSAERSETTRRRFAQQALWIGAGAIATSPLRLLGAQAAGRITEAAPFTGAGSLKAHAAARGLLTGAAVNMGLLGRDAAYTRTLAEQYNVVVAENAMKWAALRPGPARFDFAEADRFVAFAEAHGMQIRGHNLCWHEALPSWFAATVNKGNAEQFLTTHITTVVGRYKGKIRAWDVVNEAIDPKDGMAGGLRNSPWYKLLGPGYLAIAFRAARAADPHALLTYNDYGIETDSPGDTAKRAAVLKLVEGMRGSGVPIDAVGIQSHLSAGSAKQIGPGITAFVDKVAALGMKVFLTELDVNDDALATDAPGERGLQVATIYEYYVALLLAHPAVTDVLTWGVSNGTSWLNAKGSSAAKFRPLHPDRAQLCLPFNDNYTPDAAFYGLRDALSGRKQ